MNGIKRIRPTWNEYFMNIAVQVATRSCDEHTQVGAVAVNQRKRIVSTGYNSFPQGVHDELLPTTKEAITVELGGEILEISKFDVIAHAEANVIAACETSLVGSTLYTTLFPCNECAKLIITAGISEVIYKDKRPTPAHTLSRILLSQAGIKLTEIAPDSTQK